jgi:hypothetical protein
MTMMIVKAANAMTVMTVICATVFRRF